MTDELRALIERAHKHEMTPEEKFEQRVSFVYGQQDFDSPSRRSKDDIRATLVGMGYGYPGMSA